MTYEAVIREAWSDQVTQIFVYAMAACAGAGLLLHSFSSSGPNAPFVRYVPTALTSLGILGTFLGIFIGLADFDVANIDASVPTLLGGLKIAFATSIAGMISTIGFKLLTTVIPSHQQHTDGVGAEELLQELKALRRDATWQEGEVKLHEELEKEFRNDLTRWNAELDKNSLTVRFRAPEVLFDPGSPRLKPEFQSILNDFFPRYVAVLSRFEDNIEEIRIEGHTSSEWEREADQERAYFRNMDLSQARTRTVLEHCLNLANILDRRTWLREKLTANGLSSSKLIVGTDGQEDRSRSRRVEFRVRTNAKDQIVRILEAVN